MPRYDYRCSECGEQFEIVQSFDEPTLTTCPNCGQERLRKLFGNVGVVFKGSGFYRNDSRESQEKSSAPSGEDSQAKSESSASGEGAKSPSDKASDKSDKSNAGDSKKPAAEKSKSSTKSATSS